MTLAVVIVTIVTFGAAYFVSGIRITAPAPREAGRRRVHLRNERFRFHGPRKTSCRHPVSHRFTCIDDAEQTTNGIDATRFPSKLIRMCIHVCVCTRVVRRQRLCCLRYNNTCVTNRRVRTRRNVELRTCIVAVCLGG